VTVQANAYIIRPYAPVAQLDRVTGFEPVGREFESLRARQTKKGADGSLSYLVCLEDLVRTPKFESRGPESLPAILGTPTSM
jgi:hypothetical protein